MLDGIVGSGVCNHNRRQEITSNNNLASHQSISDVISVSFLRKIKKLSGKLFSLIAGF
jgi:hypothetical protein